ncbi:uncharacterized protein PAC_16366 [Phialocephala subalpina]|uniref:Uncharacterized protein n=1 Tax=Phialocephala subalpina TaxID=576137 RepID=A0A1L7XN43_9HELO|nr:uncharacterized protein PAC_16366 [Phialocephala subalpina]
MSSEITGETLKSCAEIRRYALSGGPDTPSTLIPRSTPESPKWGDRFNVNDPDEKKCLLYNESKENKKLISNILARINSLHDKAQGFLDCYNVKDAIKEISAKQMQFRQKKKIKWAIKNKEEFRDIVVNLERYNNTLEHLSGDQFAHSLQQTIPSYALAGISTHELIRRLRSIRSVEDGKYDLLTHAAQLEDIQLSWLPRQAIKDLSASEIDISSENIGQDADQTWHDLGSNGTISIQIFRWKMLLRLGNESDHCFEDGVSMLRTGYRRRGFVYAVPEHYLAKTPMSLRQIIKRCQEPPLGDKFKLAAQLATALSLLHNSQGLHKAFRSDNILFFHPLPEQSIPYSPIHGYLDSNHYYHPDVVNGFMKVLDWYIFGVVLLEIAMWRLLDSKLEKLPKEKTKDLKAIGKVFVDFAEGQLDTMTGSSYANVVRLCLSATLENDDKELACVVSNKIIAKLKYCKA